MGSSSESRNRNETEGLSAVGDAQESSNRSMAPGDELGRESEVGEGWDEDWDEGHDSGVGAESTPNRQQYSTTTSPTSRISKDTGTCDQDNAINHRHGRSTSFNRIRILEPSPPSPSSQNQRKSHRFSFAEESEPSTNPSTPPPEEEKPVTWRSLPKKGQLAIMALARLCEPLTQTSLQAYMFYQLKWFDPDVPDSTIAGRAGMLQATFTGAQFLTAILWGRIADTEFMGRKNVLIIGLFGTSLSCIGFGFSRSYAMATVFRATGGVFSSNVGVMRTMISEMVEKK